MNPHFAFSIIGNLNTTSGNDRWWHNGMNRKRTITRDITLYSIDKESKTDYGSILLETKIKFFIVINIITWEGYKTISKDVTKKNLISKLVGLI